SANNLASAVNALMLTLSLAVGEHLEDDESNKIIRSICQEIWRIISEPIIHLFLHAITILVNSRSHWCLPVQTTSKPRLLVAAQAKAEGETELPNVNEEISVILQQVENVTVPEDEGCTRDVVLAGLKDTECVHFACHGHQHRTEPFKSYFSLQECNAPLTLLDIISNSLPNAELAVLSACHSAAGDKTTPDEAIHLTAGMLLVEFRSVVGTM
ncbi:hypothetical protein FRB97_000334, partial [Tulasnella sp. 331]